MNRANIKVYSSLTKAQKSFHFPPSLLKVQDPDDPSQTLYDTMIRHHPPVRTLYSGEMAL